MMRRLIPLPLLLGIACDPRPPHFADAPAVTVIADDTPVPVPRPFEPVPEFRLSEAYLRRPLANALDPARVPYAADVNALDEVPRSSWLAPGGMAQMTDAVDLPALPLHPLAARPTIGDGEGALRVVDARGRFFEVWRDPPDRPEMSTAAAVTASRILRALGYYVPGVWAVDAAWSDFAFREPADREAVRALFASGPKPIGDRYRVGLVRWPIGIDLGPTHPFDRRIDDRNDRVAHLDRRTLRALRVVFEWLGVSRLGSGVLRDGYVGAPGAGHVVHYVVDLAGALGADAVVRPERPRDDDADLAGRNIWMTMGTFGLYAPEVEPTQDRWPSIGAYETRLSARFFQTSPPFEPFDRLLPGDAYWAAKRIAALPPEILASALDAGRLNDPGARSWLGTILHKRRLGVVARAFAAVTPCEVEEVAAGTVVLRDEAVLRGFVPAATARFRVELMDDYGAALTTPAEIVPGGSRFAVPLPKNVPGYLVLRITATYEGRAAPRPMEAHLVRRDTGWALVGVRH